VGYPIRKNTYQILGMSFRHDVVGRADLGYVALSSDRRTATEAELTYMCKKVVSIDLPVVSIG
jgi:hypothetical protein